MGSNHNQCSPDSNSSKHSNLNRHSSPNLNKHSNHNLNKHSNLNLNKPSNHSKDSSPNPSKHSNLNNKHSNQSLSPPRLFPNPNPSLQPEFSKGIPSNSSTQATTSKILKHNSAAAF